MLTLQTTESPELTEGDDAIAFKSMNTSGTANFES